MSEGFNGWAKYILGWARDRQGSNALSLLCEQASLEKENKTNKEIKLSFTYVHVNVKAWTPLPYPVTLAIHNNWRLKRLGQVVGGLGRCLLLTRDQGTTRGGLQSMHDESSIKHNLQDRGCNEQRKEHRTKWSLVKLIVIPPWKEVFSYIQERRNWIAITHVGEVRSIFGMVF